MKTLLSLAAFLIIAAAAHAQFSVSLKASVSQSRYGYDANPFAKSSDAKLVGMGAAIPVYYQLGKHFSVGAEPGIVRRGAIDPVTYSCIGFCGTGIDFSEFPYSNPSIYAEYVQLPVFIQYRFPMFKGGIEVSSKLGAGASIAMSAYQQSKYNVYENGSDIDPIDFSEDGGFERRDGGLYGGIGIGRRIGPGTLLFEAEMYRGLKSIHHSYFEFKNQSQSFSLSYRLDL